MLIHRGRPNPLRNFRVLPEGELNRRVPTCRSDGNIGKAVTNRRLLDYEQRKEVLMKELGYRYILLLSSEEHP